MPSTLQLMRVCAPAVALATFLVGHCVPASEATPPSVVQETLTFTLKSSSFDQTGARVRVGINGRTVANVTSGPTWSTHAVRVPKLKGNDEIGLLFDNGASRSVAGKSQRRTVTIGALRIGGAAASTKRMRIDHGLGWALARDDRDVHGVNGFPLTLTRDAALRHLPRPAPVVVPKKQAPVFAHYMTLFPISLDDAPTGKDYYSTEWLTPHGEGGKHRAYGGFLRDRPVGRPSRGANFRLIDAKQEILQAKAAGINGFMVDLQSTSGPQKEQVMALAKAADSVGGFSIVPTLDAYCDYGQMDPATAAKALTPLYAHPSVARQGVLSSFGADHKPVVWWRDVVAQLSELTNRKVAFHAVLLDASPENTRRFATVAAAIGSWGGRTTPAALAERAHGQSVKALGKEWIAPVAFQDVRPSGGVYAESRNSETLRNAWAVASAGGADFVQLLTWNDYSESTHIAPSRNNGTAMLTMNKLFIERMRGRTSATNQVFVTSRSQLVASKPAVPSTPMRPILAASRVTPRDGIEVLMDLDREASVRVTVGSHSVRRRVPAGLRTLVVPTGPGAIKVVVEGKGGCTVTSSRPVSESPRVSDISYHATWVQCGRG